jgi:hypothetical protein
MKPDFMSCAERTEPERRAQTTGKYIMTYIILTMRAAPLTAYLERR